MRPGMACFLWQKYLAGRASAVCCPESAQCVLYAPYGLGGSRSTPAVHRRNGGKYPRILRRRYPLPGRLDLILFKIYRILCHSERPTGVEESTHYRCCQAVIQCEDPSTTLQAAPLRMTRFFRWTGVWTVGDAGPYGILLFKN